MSQTRKLFDRCIPRWKQSHELFIDRNHIQKLGSVRRHDAGFAFDTFRRQRRQFQLHVVRRRIEGLMSLHGDFDSPHAFLSQRKRDLAAAFIDIEFAHPIC